MMRALSTSLSRVDCEYASCAPRSTIEPMAQRASKRKTDTLRVLRSPIFMYSPFGTDSITLAARCKSRLGVMMSTRSECSLAGAQVRTDFPAKEAQFAKGQTALPVLVSLAMCLGDES